MFHCINKLIFSQTTQCKEKVITGWGSNLHLLQSGQEYTCFFFLKNNTTWWRQWSWKLHGKWIRSCYLIRPIRSFKRNIGHVTQQGKQNWPIAGCAIMYIALSLYEIIKWHHTHRNFLYKQRKLGRTVIRYNWYSS